MEGVELFCREYGKNDQQLVILHGLYGSSDNWITMARQLESNYHVFVPDLRNHGRSPHTATHTYESMVTDLHQFFTTHNIKNAYILGHSMGGKVAMLFTLFHPERVKKLIVADIAPRPYSDTTNYGEITGNHVHIIEALNSLNLQEAQTRQNIDDQLSSHIKQPVLRQFLLKNIDRTKDGEFVWRLNLPLIRKSLEEVMDGFSLLPDNLSTTVPTIFIKGEMSPYVREEDLLTARKRFKGAELVTVPQAGHWLHAEQPDLFYKTISYFLEE